MPSAPRLPAASQPPSRSGAAQSLASATDPGPHRGGGLAEEGGPGRTWGPARGPLRSVGQAGLCSHGRKPVPLPHAGPRWPPDAHLGARRPPAVVQAGSGATFGQG